MDSSVGRSSSSRWIYDTYEVFINHRGPDVKGSFAAHLEEALKSVGIHPFLDKSALKKGDLALKSIDYALEASKVHVAILSKRYAESKYCLNELVDMLRSGKPIIPIFYDVEPQHLRYALVSGPFAAAFEHHKEKGREKEVEIWANALSKLAEVTGFQLQDYDRDEVKLKLDVVKMIQQRLPSNLELPVDEYKVGLTFALKQCIHKLEKMGPSIGILSIVGMGGIGKTTMVKEIFNHFASIKMYQYMTFLDDVQSAFLEVQVGRRRPSDLRGEILWDLLHVHETTFKYEDLFKKLSNQGPVFIVLDNIDDKQQFDQLIPHVNSLASKSRIIITSRNKRLLEVIAKDIPTYQYMMVPLKNSDSQKLFNWHAFGKTTPHERFQDLAQNIASACHGLPLALKVIGASLLGRTSKIDQKTIWQEAIQYMKECNDIMGVLQWSYNSLPSQSEKIMFLDIACTIHGIDKMSALACWKACKYCIACQGFRNPHFSLQCLIERCLVEDNRHVPLKVHDLLQDMAKHIVRTQSNDPTKHSHQFEVEVAQEIVYNNQGTEHIRALTLSGDRKRKREIPAESIGQMEKLHFLIMDECNLIGDFERFPKYLRYLQWRSIPHKRLPEKLNLSNLCVLDLSDSDDLAELWASSNAPMQNCPLLQSLKMKHCSTFEELPSSIGNLPRLEQLDLDHCLELKRFPESIGQLKALREMDLTNCYNLQMLPNDLGALTSLEVLMLSGCSSLESLPNSLCGCTSLIELDLSDTLLLVPPTILSSLSNLEILELSNCNGLESLPQFLPNLISLQDLSLCQTIIPDFPSFQGKLSNLEYLTLDGCGLELLPSSFHGFPNLKILTIPGNKILGYESGTKVECLSNIIGHLPSLEDLTLDANIEDFTIQALDDVGYEKIALVEGIRVHFRE